MHVTRGQMDAVRFNSAYRTALGIVLVYVLFMLVPNVVQYTQLVAGGVHEQKEREARARRKLSATDLAALLAQANRLGADAQLRCEPAARDWDYVCSYLPTELKSPTRLHFGVTVDLKRWTSVSSIVPVGTPIPPPK